MKQILLVTHAPSANTLLLKEAVVQGVHHPDISGVNVLSLSCLEAGAKEVLTCDAVIIGTTENFGYMAGLTKDFFERIYYPCLEKTQGLPVAVFIRAGQDGRGTLQSIEKITTGLRWKLVYEPTIFRGEWNDGFVSEVRELGMNMAAGLELGIY